jgi:hypothetical protein
VKSVVFSYKDLLINNIIYRTQVNQKKNGTLLPAGLPAEGEQNMDYADWKALIKTEKIRGY